MQQEDVKRQTSSRLSVSWDYWVRERSIVRRERSIHPVLRDIKLQIIDEQLAEVGAELQRRSMQGLVTKLAQKLRATDFFRK